MPFWWNPDADRERSRRRYRDDLEYRERKRTSVRRAYRKRNRATPGHTQWIRAHLEALRRRP